MDTVTLGFVAANIFSFLGLYIDLRELLVAFRGLTKVEVVSIGHLHDFVPLV